MDKFIKKIGEKHIGKLSNIIKFYLSSICSKVGENGEVWTKLKIKKTEILKTLLLSHKIENLMSDKSLNIYYYSL